MSRTLTTDYRPPTTASQTLKSPLARPRLAWRSSLAASKSAGRSLATGDWLPATAVKSFAFRYDFVSRSASVTCRAFVAKYLIRHDSFERGRMAGMGLAPSFYDS